MKLLEYALEANHIGYKVYIVLSHSSNNKGNSFMCDLIALYMHDKFLRIVIASYGTLV